MRGRERERGWERESGRAWTRGGRRSPPISQTPSGRRADESHGRRIWVRRGKGDHHCGVQRSEGDISLASFDLAPDLESRFRNLKEKLHEGRSKVPRPQEGAAFGSIKLGVGRDGRKRTNLNVAWADRGGVPLASSCAVDKGGTALSEGSSCLRGDDGCEVRAIIVGGQSQDREEDLSLGSRKAPRMSYKDALLTEQPKSSRLPPSSVQQRVRPLHKPPQPYSLANSRRMGGALGALLRSM